MSYKKSIPLAMFLFALVLGGPAFADAPQLRVNSAGYAFNVYFDQDSWECNDDSELNGGTCYASPVADYTFPGSGIVVQDPIMGTFVAITSGGAGEKSFQENRGDSAIVSWIHTDARAGRKELRETTIVDNAFLGLPCSNSMTPCHWVLKDAFWGKQSAGLDNLYVFVNAIDTGKLGMSKNQWLVYATSSNGTTNFQWTKVFEMVRPDGAGSGSKNLTNTFRFMQDPADDARWIGLLDWTFKNDPEAPAVSGTTPMYILPNQGRFGILFEDAGWCHYDMFTRFTGFSDDNDCGSKTTEDGGITWEASLGDRFYSAPGLAKDSADLSLINGKALVLKDIWRNPANGNAFRCDSWDTIDDDGDGIDDYGSESECAIAHANCGPGLDKSLYYVRSRDAELLDRRWPRSWTVRELDYSTWDTSQSALTWVGEEVPIIDAPRTDPEFKINPTDNPTIGGFHGGKIVQHNNGSIFLYLGVKHILCEPAETGASAWNRFPISGSGKSSLWLKLVVIN